jgi:hypothetical protein
MKNPNDKCLKLIGQLEKEGIEQWVPVCWNKVEELGFVVDSEVYICPYYVLFVVIPKRDHFTPPEPCIPL